MKKIFNQIKKHAGKAIGLGLRVIGAVAFFLWLASFFIPSSQSWNAACLGWVAAVVLLFYDGLSRVLRKIQVVSGLPSVRKQRQLLKEAIREMSKVRSLDHLLGLIIHYLTFRMGVRSAAIFTSVENKNGYGLDFQRGYGKNFLEYHIDSLHPLAETLLRIRRPLNLKSVRSRLPFRKGNTQIPGQELCDYQAIFEIMSDFDAVCCVPSFLGKELRNILMLGPKKNGKAYSEEETFFIYDLAQDAAYSIENARLLDATNAKKDELKEVNEQLEFAKDKLMEALLETEQANKRLQDAHAQLIHEQKMATLGRLAASVGHEVNNPLTILSMNVSRVILKYRKNPDLKISDVFDLFQKMEQNIGRIKAVVNTLTGLLKRSEKGKFEPLSLKLILEETLPLVQFQTYLENLTGTDVSIEIPASLPLISGDLERLQEVFLNLFINAYHAMVGKRHRRIRVTAEVNPQDDQSVCIYFSDNGKGMTDDIQKKIFNYGYTTKPPGKGSGMGLYMCKYIIELHGGSISVSSTSGVGTTFVLTLPVYQEKTSSLSIPEKVMF